MVWWAWFVLAGLLMGIEVMLIDAAFYLMFIGFAALITGFVLMSGVALENWVQWVLFSGLAASSMVLFRKKLYEKLRGDAPGFNASPKGKIIELEQDLASGDSCRVSYRGTQWTVKNSGPELVQKGSTKIISVKGLTLMVGGE